MIWAPTKLISLFEDDDDRFFDEAGVMLTSIDTLPDTGAILMGVALAALVDEVLAWLGVS